MSPQAQSVKPLESIRRSPFFQLFLIGLLILALQIPIHLIQGLVRERQARQREAVEEVASKWGRPQTVVGPLLVVPYKNHLTETDKDGVVKKERIELRPAVFLPEELQISGQLETEKRYRGIFQVPVYRLILKIKGSFSRPDFSGWDVAAEDIAWDRAFLILRVADARAITNQAALDWNEAQLPFVPGIGDFGGRHSGIHLPLKDVMTGDSYRFSTQLHLRGSEAVYLAPFGKVTVVDIKSNWTDPSFQGAWLPTHRSIGPDGFEAKWEIPSLGRNYSQKSLGETGFDDAVALSLFGVKLVTPVDLYRMSERSVKYDLLFLVLTFATLWLFEVLAKIRVHPIQYLLMGAAMCVFYLLELSLAEHLGFTLAYILASLAVVAMLYFYSAAVLRSYQRSLVIGGATAALYGYLYILLVNQDYSLLFGSICLFFILAGVMYLTRKVDWYALMNVSPPRLWTGPTASEAKEERNEAENNEL